MTNIFYYQGRDKNGNIVKSNLAAENLEEVIAHLKNFEITPINIRPVREYSLNLKNLIGSLSNKWIKIEPYHLMNFCRQLATLNNAGLSMVKAINKLAQSASSRPLAKILATVANDISAGMTLSDALKKHPQVFSSIIVSVIDVGENTGHLSEALLYLSNYIEASIANRRRLLSAIRYPIFVFITVAIAMIVMNFMVIPKFSQMFSKFNLELPWATKIIIASSNFMVNNKISLIVAIVVLCLGINKSLSISRVRYFWDKYKLCLPVFGDLQRRVVLSQFTWTFSLILHSGVPIIKGISLASSATENSYFSEQLLKMRMAIEHGESLSRAAIASDLFTPITIQMIEVGEESEKLDEVLSEVAKYYDAEIDYDLKRLNELIEPILLVIIGSMILVLALGIYFPMWDLIKIAKV